MKKILKWTGITLLLLVIFLVAAPFLFKDKIVSKIKEEANKNLIAKIDFGDFDLSLIRSFPNFSLGIENLSIINLAPFEGDTLIYAKKLNLTVDIMSVIKGSEIKILSIDLTDPVLNFLVNKEGKANWDITKPTTAAEASAEPSTFQAKLKHYEIKNGRLVYHDQTMAFYMSLTGLDHEGKGDFTQDLFELNTHTEAKSTNLSYEGIPYISRAKTVIEAKLSMDMKNSKYTFLENKIKLNELDLGLNGWVAMPDTNIDMELDFAAAKSDFKNFISMIPAIYNNDFGSLKSSGTMALSGFIKGRYNGVSMPGFGLILKIDNGMFQYPSLPSSVSNVFVDLKVNNPDGVPDHTIVDLKKLHLEMAGAPFDAKLLLKTPVSDPDLDAFVKGKIDLGAIQKFVPLEDGTTLTGLITADISAKGRMSSIEQQKYEQFTASGNLVVKDMNYAAKDLSQPVSLSILDLSFNPKNVVLKALNGKSGKTDFNASGSLENFLAYALKDEKLRGNLNLKSTKMDLNEWMGESTTSTTAASDTAAMTVIEVPANIDFTMTTNIGTLYYQNITMFNVNGVLRVHDQIIDMKSINMQMLDGSMGLSGQYNSVNLKKPLFNFDLAIKEFNISKTVTTFATVEKMAPIAKACTGKFSVNMNVKGDLDQQMSPVINSLTGGGKLNTSKIIIQGFPAFDKVADLLEMPSWKKLEIPSVNPSFNFANGRVYVDPVDVNINGMKGIIAGSNGFDQTIDYTMAMEIPRSAFGGSANAVLDNLVKQANSKGANFSVGDVIPVTILLKGTVNNPTVSSDLKKQGANAMEDLKAKAKDEFEKQKAAAEAKAREEADKLKKQAETEIDKQKANANAEADRLKKEAEAKAKATTDSLKKAAEKEATKKANDAIKNLNPFKK